ncbi:MAG TPA: MFS transporter [Gemmataceae bacterium]|nr:MFS transporter [Gemmataceae bacterium]
MNDRPTNVRYIVLFGLCLAAGLAYIHRGCISVVESTVRDDLDMTKAQMGWVIGIFYWAYALFQIPTGLLVDAWGPRRALFLFGVLGGLTVAMAAGTLWVNVATGFVLLLASRLLMGIAQAGLFPGSTRAISVWMPLRQRAFAAGVLQACMSLGGAVGAFVTGSLLEIVSWPWVFVLYAVPGLVWSFWFFGWFRDRPERHGGTNDAERALLESNSATGQHAGTWRDTFTNRGFILVCAQQFFRAASNVFWFSWCPTYLQEVCKLDKGFAGKLTSLPILGVMAGSIVGGLAADWVLVRTGSLRASRSGVAITATTLGVIIFTLTYAIPNNQVALTVAALTAAAIVVSCGNSCGYSAAMDLGGRNLATVFAAMNMFGNFGAALFSQIVPAWVDGLGWPAAVLLVGGSYLLGAICWLPLDPGSRSRPVQSNDSDPVDPEITRR